MAEHMTAPTRSGSSIDARAVIVHSPNTLGLDQVELKDPGEDDVLVDIRWSGISTGTERLLCSGDMPPFPGMGYPLVPGYESVGVISDAGPMAERKVGETVFVPGADCYRGLRGLFGGSASRVVVPSKRVVPLAEAGTQNSVLFALAATAYHSMSRSAGRSPELIVGHGVLGRLLARLAVLAGGNPVVWETQDLRMEGGQGYRVLHPDDDPRKDYESVYDVSGDSSILDSLVSRLAPGGEIVLAGFYKNQLAFSFAPAFMREARIRVAAEWKESDLTAVTELVKSGRLSLDGLITHRRTPDSIESAYDAAFNDPSCLKMVIDWNANG